MSIWRLGSDELADGIYERVISAWLERRLQSLDPQLRSAHDKPLSPDASVGHLARLLHDAFLIAAEKLKGASTEQTVELRVELANELLERLRKSAGDTFRDGETTLLPKLLLGVATHPALGVARFPEPPSTSLLRSDLLVNGEQRSLIGELLSEIDSADRIDLLCAFIKWSGFVKFREALRRHCQDRRRPLRVLTTTYLGATDPRAVKSLEELGAEIRVSYDVETTRLHAKAWLFHRRSGFHTAYVGSSNLSSAALTDGLEWNVRLTNADAPQVIDRFRSVFDSYWEDPESGFVAYDRAQEQFFRDGIARARGESSAAEQVLLPIEVVPRGYQQDMLEQLERARQAGRRSNLVVAATGTGKTLVAAFDFKRLHDSGAVKSLLFIAHRREILKQSQALFAHIARVRGELLVDGERPAEGRYVFASIQSLAKSLQDGALPPAPDAYDMVIVDEVHHAAADTYARLLRHLQPRELLGLTATPERADGLSLHEFFPGPFAAELRVWDAIERQILVPFNYFGIDDGTDLSQVKWKRGTGYATAELRDKLISSAHVWVGKVVRSIADFVSDHSSMRALAFCVDIAHARFVAEQLAKHGIRAEALTSETDDELRRSAVERLRSNDPQRPQVLCTVDLFNEGVDIPEVDTVLMLRPTESATVFLQQLGRGLRRAQGKDSLLVLDFIGKQHERFRFDLRFRALTGQPRRELERSLKSRFGRLPAGCTIQLEPEAMQHVLDSVRRALPSTQNAMVDELRALGRETTLAGFLDATGLELADLYANGRSWSALRRAAGFESGAPVEAEADALARVMKVLHADDSRRLDVWEALAREPGSGPANEADRRIAAMLFGLVYDLESASDLGEACRLFASHPSLRAELSELIPCLRRASRLVERALPLAPAIPLVGHARYRSEELAAAFDIRSKGKGKLYISQKGVVGLPSGHELLLTTLEKNSKKKLPHLLYNDYAVSPTEFHWQSQADTTVDSKQGRRHLAHRELGVVPLLFVRETEKDSRGETMGFRYLGPVEHLRHEGERPITVWWRLAVPMPAELVREARAAAA